MTERYYLVGGSVADSPSPPMMNSAFRSLGIDAVYSALSVERSEFPQRFLSLRKECSGMNITIPFKSEVIPLLDELDPISMKIGAVNAIRTSAGRCFGFNTDVNGIVSPLREHTGRSGVGRSLLVGAGGAARAFCEAMSQIGCRKVTVAVRDIGRGRRFVEEVSRVFPEVGFDLVALGNLSEELGEHGVAEYGLIFNATPMGSVAIPLAEEIKRVIYGREIVFDAVYKPIQTELLKFAKEKGCRVIHGYEMLLNQGRFAFEKWTGVRAPTKVMEQALMHSLGVAN